MDISTYTREFFNANAYWIRPVKYLYEAWDVYKLMYSRIIYGQQYDNSFKLWKN